MKADSLEYIRNGTDAEAFFSGLSELLFAAFPGRLAGTYVVGSRADGTAIPTSDVDLAIVFEGNIAGAERNAIKRIFDAIQRISPVMLDAYVLSETEAERGVTPTLQNYRLISGRDSLKDRPLRPNSELMLHYAGLVVHFIQVVRNDRGPIRFPLTYPSGSNEYCGYEKYGTRTADGRYAPGFNLLLTLVLAIASYRLAARASVFTRAKSGTVPNYLKFLTDDPWRPMIEELHMVIRTRLMGRLPQDGGDRAVLLKWCPRVLELENEFLSELIMSIESWLPIEDPQYRQQLAQFVAHIDCHSPVHSAKLAELKKLLGNQA